MEDGAFLPGLKAEVSSTIRIMDKVIAIVIVGLILVLVASLEALGVYIIWNYVLVALFKCSTIGWLMCFLIMIGINLISKAFKS